MAKNGEKFIISIILAALVMVSVLKEEELVHQYVMEDEDKDGFEKIIAPMGQIESIKVIDTGNGNGVNTLGKSVTKTMLEIQEPLKELTGMDLTQLLNNFSMRGNNVQKEVKEAEEKKEDNAE